MSLPVLTVPQMREWEDATWAAGITEESVIRRVGEKLARWILDNTRKGDRILVLAGKGNNGEDARKTIPHLSERQVTLLDVREPGKALPDIQSVLEPRPDLVVDGLFGIGLSRALDENWCAAIEAVNASGCRVLSVDGPSGLDAESGEIRGAAVRATVTVTLGAPKRGLLRTDAAGHVGRLEVEPDIGLVECPIETEVLWTEAGDFDAYPPPRAVSSNKGSFGHLVILAGSLGYHGASVLAARGAQRARPGLVSLFTEERVYGPVASQLQAVMVHPWSDPLNLPPKATAMLAGPGLAAGDLSNDWSERVVKWWKGSGHPMIVDASALGWLPEGGVDSTAARVVTPHPGEAARLLGCDVAGVQNDRFQAVRELSRRFGGCWVVLKGHQTVVGREAGPLYVNSSGSPSLAQGGSGDVLAGLLAGLLAQPRLAEDVAGLLRYGVWRHGAAAEALDRGGPRWTIEEFAGQV